MCKPDIDKIRRLKGVLTQKEIASLFKVSEYPISRIMNRKSWV